MDAEAKCNKYIKRYTTPLTLNYPLLTNVQYQIQYRSLPAQCPVMCGSCNEAPEVERRASARLLEITVNGKLRMVPHYYDWTAAGCTKVAVCSEMSAPLNFMCARVFLDCF